MRKIMLAGALVLFILAPRVADASDAICIDSLAVKFSDELARYETEKREGKFAEFESSLPRKITWEMACAVFDTLDVPKAYVKKIKRVWEDDKEFRSSLQYLILFFAADKLDLPEKAESKEEMADDIRDVVTYRIYMIDVAHCAERLSRAARSCSGDEVDEIIEELQQIKWVYEAEDEDEAY